MTSSYIAIVLIVAICTLFYGWQHYVDHRWPARDHDEGDGS
jgi:hypothetical protein